jgi:hypothetical protein
MSIKYIGYVENEIADILFSVMTMMAPSAT